MVGPEPLTRPDGGERLVRRPRVWVKVCGLRREEDVREAVRAGADGVGFILAAASPRRVTPSQAAALAEAARREAAAAGRQVLTVAVVAGEEEPAIVEAAARSGVDAVQLHGGEPEAVARRLAARGFRVIRTVWPGGAPQEDEPLPDGPRPWAFLLDSRTPRLTGGTGRSLEPSVAAAWVRHLTARGARVVLAGGLRPDNVSRLLSAVLPWGVDVSSGVEVPGQPGVKDPPAIREFVARVRAWEEEDDAAPA